MPGAIQPATLPPVTNVQTIQMTRDKIDVRWVFLREDVDLLRAMAGLHAVPSHQVNATSLNESQIV
jgi:hypothetical protein